MRVGVIGAGATGARVARQLIATHTVDEVVLRDLRLDRLDTVVRSLGPGASADRGRSDEPLDVDAVVLAMGPGAHVEQATRALEAGQFVVSVADSVDEVRALVGLDDMARELERTVVVGSGFAPGLTCLLAAWAGASFDRVDEIHVAKVGTGGPACARVHHAALGDTAIDWRDGEWDYRPGGSGRELFWFPDPIEARDCYRAALPDALLLHAAFPGVGRITSRVAATRRDRLTANLPMLRPPHPEGGPGAVRVELRGEVDGRHVVKVLGVMERPAVAAAAILAVAIQWCLQGRMRRHGAAGLAELADAPAMLTALRTRNIRVEVFDGVPRVVGAS